MTDRKPEEIEKTSMAIIEAELERRGWLFPPEEAPVIKRVIHTTADFDYAENLRFIHNPVRQGKAALRQGTIIVTDTNMAKAGISCPAMEKLKSSAVCYMADTQVAREAKARGVTRATVSMERAVQAYPEGIFAVGNAPTALFTLSKAMEEGFRPALIIGVPVGFVNVVEAKETLLDVCKKYHVPALLAMGRKGGSTVAAAICNALLYETVKEL